MPAFFHDPSGRTLILRGVNLADGKCPKDQPSHILSSLDSSPSSSSSRVTYLDTPFSLADAPTHLSKLRALGFTILRLPVVWEALEHQGPGRYDEAYIAHIRALVELSVKQYGFRVIVNPHQDLWSRFAGGSGAPLWTLHACGLDPAFFSDTHAAVRYAEWPAGGDMSEAGGRGQRKKDPRSIPPMMWTSNHNRLAASTLFTLFWAGRDVAPKCVLDGMNIQDYLQTHYFAAYHRLAEALGDLVFAYDSMNEPEPGFLGWQDLERNEREDSAMMGSAPTPIQGMRLGMGMEQVVDTYKLGKTGPHKSGTESVQPGRGCWLKEEDPRWTWHRSEEWTLGKCVWALHDVWDVETGELKKPGYFAKIPPDDTLSAMNSDSSTSDYQVDWKSKYWKAMFDQWVVTIRKSSPRAIMFIQAPVFESPPPNLISSITQPELMAYSPHFYDALTIMKKHWHKHWNVDILSLLRGRQDISNKLKALRVGEKNVRQVIADQLGALAVDVMFGDDNNKERQLVPTLIGETGIPFNLDDGKAYRNGDYTSHVTALDAILSGCDEHLLNYTLWAYSTVNTHEWGDHWNGEDLSIYSRDTGSFPGHKYLTGFRAPAAWCRPYVQSLIGRPSRMSFDLNTSRFELEIKADTGGDAIIYIPWLHYRKSDDSDELHLKVHVSHGQWTLDTEKNILNWTFEEGGSLNIRLKREGGALSPQELGTVLSI